MIIDIHFYDHRPPVAIYSRVEEPPAQFDHPCEHTEVDLPSTGVDAVCGRENMACIFLDAPGGPIVVLPKIGPGGVSKWMQDLLRRHEIAHCNGWRH